MTFHERLRRLREETGLTQKDTAISLGISQSLYSKWENGKSAPNYDRLRWLARHFKVTTDYLLGLSKLRNTEIPVAVTYFYEDLNELERRLEMLDSRAADIKIQVRQAGFAMSRIRKSISKMGDERRRNIARKVVDAGR